MPSNDILVRCTYTEDGEKLSELFEESFRLFLIRTLALKKGEVVSYFR